MHALYIWEKKWKFTKICNQGEKIINEKRENKLKSLILMKREKIIKLLVISD